MPELSNQYAVSVTTPPTVEPVTLNEAKLQCAVEVAESYWNDDISSLITAAREYVESRGNVSLTTQTLTLHLPRFPVGRDRQFLPRGPVQSVAEISYTDETGATQTIADAQLSVGHVPAFILPAVGKSWPTVRLESANPVRIRYVAGYGAPSDVPQTARRLVLLLVAHWFRNRESVLVGSNSKEIEFAAEALFNQISPGDSFVSFGQCATR